MSSQIKILCFCLALCSCQSFSTPEQEVYAYLLENLEVTDNQDGAFILQNPGSPCGGCINAGNKLAERYSSVPTITTLSRRRLISAKNCIIDTTGGAFDLLPSTFISYVLIKNDQEFEFIPLEQKNHQAIAQKFDELKLN